MYSLSRQRRNLLSNVVLTTFGRQQIGEVFRSHLYSCVYLCREQKTAAAAKAAMKQQNKRNATLLSFDEEEEAEEDAVAKAKIRSYHDAVEDKR